MFNKDKVAHLFRRIRGVAIDPVNSTLEKGPRSYLDPNTDDPELNRRLLDSLEEIRNIANSARNAIIPGGTKENDDPNDYEVDRHPIFISDNSALLITVFKATNSLSHMFIHDYIDYRKQQDVAAKDLIKQIAPLCSVNFLWCLKEAIDQEITEHNNKYTPSKPHPLDRPKEEIRHHQV